MQHGILPLYRHLWDPKTNQHIAGPLPGYDEDDQPIAVNITSGDESWKQFVSIASGKLRVFGVNLSKTSVRIKIVAVSVSTFLDFRELYFLFILKFLFSYLQMSYMSI